MIHSLTCISNNDKLLALMPKDTASCLKECQTKANKADGCAENDFACHCVNYNTYSNVRSTSPSKSTSFSAHCTSTPHHYPFPIPSHKFLHTSNILTAHRALRLCAPRSQQQPSMHTAGARRRTTRYQRHVQFLQRDIIRRLRWVSEQTEQREDVWDYCQGGDYCQPLVQILGKTTSVVSGRMFN